MKQPATSGDGIEGAVAALQAGRLEDAERQLRQLQRRSPGDVRLMHLLGSLALQRNLPTEAVAQFERAVAAAPAEPGFRGLLGNACRAAGRPDRAQEAYRSVLALDPHSVPALINLGNCDTTRGLATRDMAGNAGILWDNNGLRELGRKIKFGHKRARNRAF